MSGCTAVPPFRHVPSYSSSIFIFLDSVLLGNIQVEWGAVYFNQFRQGTCILAIKPLASEAWDSRDHSAVHGSHSFEVISDVDILYYQMCMLLRLNRLSAV